MSSSTIEVSKITYMTHPPISKKIGVGGGILFLFFTQDTSKGSILEHIY